MGSNPIGAWNVFFVVVCLMFWFAFFFLLICPGRSSVVTILLPLQS